MPRQVPVFDAAIRAHYEVTDEEDRLDSGPSQLERERTRELIAARLPQRPCTVLDVGGGPGLHAGWLASRGHRVHLVDPVLALVRRASAAARGITTCTVGDARALPFPDASAHAVLLLGPLYHLTDRSDRLLALGEAYRVLVPGAPVFAAGISRWASALDGLSRDLFADPRFAAIVERDLECGQHRNDTGDPGYFTTAFLHTPEQLEDEMAEVGFAAVAVHGLEGPGWILPDFDERWRDPRRRGDLLRVARALGREPDVRGASAHLLGIGRR